jgi:Protein of unknown function (DUF3455)
LLSDLSVVFTSNREETYDNCSFLKGYIMQSTKRLFMIKRLLPGIFSLLILGLLAACAPNQPTVAAPKTPLQISQSLSFTQDGANTIPQASYPDPNDQSTLPSSVKVTNGDTVLLRAIVTQGYQVYECQASSTSASGFAWTLQSPLAILKADQGTNVIHSAGPSWLYTQDGSMVTGAVAASATQDVSAVPWLRLDIKEHLGKTGLFNNVDQIQRLYTKGGIAPSSGCNQDAAKQHEIQPVSYTAEYVFWGHK